MGMTKEYRKKLYEAAALLKENCDHTFDCLKCPFGAPKPCVLQVESGCPHFWNLDNFDFPEEDGDEA